MDGAAADADPADAGDRMDASDASTATDASDAESPADAAADAGLDATQDADAPEALPMHLRDTGLYAAGSTSELASGVMAYAPRYELWSDGASKQRYLWLHEGSTIDTSDPDAFVFPVGTKAWKEFSHGDQRLETRLLWKTESGWLLVAYAWNQAQDDAIASPRGAQNVLGTGHDVPQRADCRTCHNGASDVLLGVDAVQLAHEGPGLTLAQLTSDGRLSHALPSDIARPDALAWNALGYLHANCGSCHSPRGTGYERVDLELWLPADSAGGVESTPAYRTTVGVAIEQGTGTASVRIAAGSSAQSGVIERMRERGEDTAMPPLASEHVDDAGVALVSEWIDSL